MKANHSLSISRTISERLKEDLSGVFYEMFPFDITNRNKTQKQRDRVYNTETTLLTMITTMTQEDKSLQNSVNLYSLIHRRNIDRLEQQEYAYQNKMARGLNKRQRGRPQKYASKVAKSKRKDISKDTSAYSQARQRLSKEIVNDVFKSSKDLTGKEYLNKWHGYRVFITDGSYLQMQDTEKIKEQFTPIENNEYPRGLLQVVIEQGSGLIYDFILGNDKQSELETFSRMIDNIATNSLILADDLYNCYAIFSLLKQRGIDVIVPGKRERNYKVIKELSTGDEIVQIKKSTKSKWLKDKAIADTSLTMRRISYKNPLNESQTLVLYSSLLDKSIEKEEIILKYESRWDIEICIREIKTIMDINIIRAKTPDMAYKELATALIAYNYIRRIIVNSSENKDFFPEADIIQKYYEIDKPVYVDKLGRKYFRWSPGRKPETNN